MNRFFIFLIILLTFLVPKAEAQYFGTIAAGSVHDFKFTTRDGTGLPTTLSGTPAIKCFKSNSTSPESTLPTLSVDFGGTTGLNNLRVDTSVDSSFYAPQSDISCIITAGTVASIQVVGETVVQFRISSDFTVQKNVAFTNFPIWMLSTNGTAVLGLSPSCTIQKDNGSFSSTANSAIEVGSGKYRLDLTATETNANVIAIICTGGSAVPYRTNVTPQQ